MADREDPLVAFKFGLEIEGKLAVISPTSGESAFQRGGRSQDRQPGNRRDHHPEDSRPSDLDRCTLKRGVTSNVDVWDWRQQVVDGKVDDARTNCSIVAYNQANEEIARWNLEAAWPSKVTGPEMDGLYNLHDRGNDHRPRGYEARIVSCALFGESPLDG